MYYLYICESRHSNKNVRMCVSGQTSAGKDWWKIGGLCRRWQGSEEEHSHETFIHGRWCCEVSVTSFLLFMTGNTAFSRFWSTGQPFFSCSFCGRRGHQMCQRSSSVWRLDQLKKNNKKPFFWESEQQFWTQWGFFRRPVTVCPQVSTPVVQTENVINLSLRSMPLKCTPVQFEGRL